MPFYDLDKDKRNELVAKINKEIHDDLTKGENKNKF
jgi:hypothetical protein